MKIIINCTAYVCSFFLLFVMLVCHFFSESILFLLQKNKWKILSKCKKIVKFLNWVYWFGRSVWCMFCVCVCVKKNYHKKNQQQQKKMNEWMTRKIEQNFQFCCCIITDLISSTNSIAVDSFTGWCLMIVDWIIYISFNIEL